MTSNMRNAGRTAVLAAMMVAPLLLASACQAKAPDAPPAVSAPPAPATPVVESLSIETARGPVTFKVEIADEEMERQRGLMFRTSLAPDAGMLFEFEGSAPRAFWMKNTYIPLDILYIGANGRIISIAAMTEPFSETPIPSHGAAKGVLEIAGGRAAQLGIDIGDRVNHGFFAQ